MEAGWGEGSSGKVFNVKPDDPCSSLWTYNVDGENQLLQVSLELTYPTHFAMCMCTLRANTHTHTHPAKIWK